MYRYEELPAIEGYAERAIRDVKVSFGRPLEEGEKRHRGTSRYYTVAELNELLDGPHAIWGFDPFSGHAELVRRSAIEWAVQKYPKRKGTISFSWDDEASRHRHLQLIPSYTTAVQLVPQYNF